VDKMVAVAMENKKKNEGKGGNSGGTMLDVVSIIKAIEVIENDMQKSMGELAMLRKQVAGSRGGKEMTKKKVGKVIRVVGWLTRRPGADARDSGFVIGDVVKITNVVKYKETKKKMKGTDVTGVVKDITKRFIVVKCMNPEGIEEDVNREPHHVCFIERKE